MRHVKMTAFVLIAVCLWPLFHVWADDYLELKTTIPVLRDSTFISSITPIGDFNADGYPDLAVGLSSAGFYSVFESLYLYYGGPGFDSIPDLRFFGDRQDTTICRFPYEWGTGFGHTVTALGDFNGDGFADFAASAFSLCTFDSHVGRVYVYFGGPQPDTIPDLVFDGIRDYDAFGSMLASGDLNGDDLGDLLVHAGDSYYGERICIFFGGNPPDTTLDWVYGFPPADPDIRQLGAGPDLNGDGYSEF